MNGFNELKLSPKMLEAISAMGFKEPTPIQAQALPLLFQGRDIIGQAKTGTGKTAAFGIYLLEKMDYANNRVQAIILTPTRELAVQVSEEIRLLSRGRNVYILPVYGGASMENQIRALSRGVHIVVGTPGRVIDHLKRGTLNLSGVRNLVIDEGDRMLDMGFIDDVEFIMAKTPASRQTTLFSATMPPEILRLTQKYMRSPEHLKVSSDDKVVVTHIKQSFVSADHRDKLYAFLAYLADQKPLRTIVFCRTKFGASKLTMILHDRGYNAECLHGDMSQSKRDSVMRAFKEGRVMMLVATDLAARGLDIDDITHVVNYNIPEEADTYVHRVGRTGRMGKSGDAVTFVAKDELGKLGEIERAIDVRMREHKVDIENVKKQHHGGPRKHEYERRRFSGRESHGRGGGHGGTKPHSAVPHTYNL